MGNYRARVRGKVNPRTGHAACVKASVYTMDPRPFQCGWLSTGFPLLVVVYLLEMCLGRVRA